MIIIRRCCLDAICHSWKGYLVPSRTIVVPIRKAELLGGGDVLLLVFFRDIWRVGESLGDIGDLAEQSLLCAQESQYKPFIRKSIVLLRAWPGKVDARAKRSGLRGHSNLHHLS